MIGVLGCVATVVLSGSRGALLGSIVVFLVVALASIRQYWKLFTATVSGIALLVFIIPFTRNRVFTIDRLTKLSTTEHLLLLKESYSLVKRHLLFGVGPNGFENAIVPYHSLQWQEVIGPANPPSSPHDIIFQVLLSGGMVLLVIFLGISFEVVSTGYLILRRSKLTWELGCLAAIAGYFVVLLFYFTTPGTTPIAAFLGGSLLAICPRHNVRNDRHPTRVWLLIIASAAMAVIFLLGSLAEIELQSGISAVGHNHLTVAQRRFTLAIDLLPWDPDVIGQIFHSYVSSVAAGNSQSREFASYWQSRLSVETKDEQVTENMAALAELEGNYNLSLVLSKQGLGRDPYNPQFLILEGADQAQLGMLASAERSLRLAATIQPTNAAIWTDLAIVYKDEGLVAQAQRASNKASKLLNS
jgi:hypothetical protein